MVTITINGMQIDANEGDTILMAARANDIDIPSLCWNDGVKPYGACRLCIVEITKGERSFIDTACSYPVAEGISVKTETLLINESRKVALELHLARCPDDKIVQDLAARYGVTSIPKEYGSRGEGCTLCGLCVSACNDVVGAGAIQFAKKDNNKAVASPFEKKAEACLGCGSCEFICPCNYIEKIDSFSEEASKRKLVNWKVDFKLKECTVCGNPYAPEAHLEAIRKEKFLPKEFFNICPSCRTYPEVDHDKCKGCGCCTDICPCGALELIDKGGANKRAYIFNQNCTACHSCEMHCTMRAIS